MLIPLLMTLSLLAVLFLCLTRIAVSGVGRDNNIAMQFVYQLGIGRWFPKSASYLVAKLRVLGGKLWGPRQSYAKERLLSFNALIFLRSVSRIKAMVKAGDKQRFTKREIPKDIAECDVIVFWHTYDYLYDLNDLLYSTQGDTRPILIVRRYPHPSFQKLVSDLCATYGRDVIYVLTSDDMMAVKKSRQDASAIWLVGAEFMFRKSGGAAKTFQRKVLGARAVCVHTPWPDAKQRWQKCQAIKATAPQHLANAKKFFGLSLIWPHILQSI